MRRIRNVEAAAIGAACLVFFIAGCSGQKTSSTTPAPPSASPPPAQPVSTDTLAPATVHPDESGVIPVLSFRDIVSGPKAPAGDVTVDDFKKDLDWLYAHDYRPVSLTDMALGKVDCPARSSPVVITFAEGLPGQYRIGADGNTDPNCAIAILEAFNSEHSDWPLKGTFFVDADSAAKKSEFGSTNATDYKIEHLTADGFELGCSVPPSESKTDSVLTNTLAHSVTILATDNKDSTVAAFIQSGAYPHDLDVLKSGMVVVKSKMPNHGPAPMGGPAHPMMPPAVSHPLTYTTSCAVTSGNKCSYSPASTKFDPYHIPSIAISSAFGVDAALKALPNAFVSDGDPTTILVPESEKSQVTDKLLTPNGVSIKTYPPAITASSK